MALNPSLDHKKIIRLKNTTQYKQYTICFFTYMTADTEIYKMCQEILLIWSSLKMASQHELSQLSTFKNSCNVSHVHLKKTKYTVPKYLLT